jgi:hypothetical protein
MILRKTKKWLHTVLFIASAALLLVTAATSYGGVRTLSKTFTGNQTKAVLADDLFNACHSTCPTQQQVMHKVVASLPMFNVMRTSSTPPVLLQPAQSTVIFVSAVALLLYVSLYTTSRKKCALHALWRN